MTTNTTYEIVAAPKHSDFQISDCLICGHAELSKPVWLRSSNGVTFAAGAGCAAKAVYGDNVTANRTKARTTAAIVQTAVDTAEEMATEVKERFAQALADFNAGVNFSNELQSARVAFHAAKPKVDFPTFMATVVATGAVAA